MTQNHHYSPGVMFATVGVPVLVLVTVVIVVVGAWAFMARRFMEERVVGLSDQGLEMRDKAHRVVGIE